MFAGLTIRQQSHDSTIDRTERKQFVRSPIQTSPLHLSQTPENLNLLDNRLHRKSAIVPVIVKQTQRRFQRHLKTVQIGKPLLRFFQPNIEKQNQRHRLISQLRIFPQSHLKRRPAMLSVINRKLSIHRHPQATHFPFFCLISHRFKSNIRINRSSNCPTSIICRILNKIVSNFRNPAAIQRPFCPQFWRQIF